MKSKSEVEKEGVPRSQRVQLEAGTLLVSIVRTPNSDDRICHQVAWPQLFTDTADRVPLALSSARRASAVLSVNLTVAMYSESAVEHRLG